MSNPSSDELAARIVHLLSIYPCVSPSMMQIGLGVKAGLWRPVLDTMIEDGRVTRNSHNSTTPSGRHQSYTILTLTPDDGDAE